MDYTVPAALAADHTADRIADYKVAHMVAARTAAIVAAAGSSPDCTGYTVPVAGTVKGHIAAVDTEVVGTADTAAADTFVDCIVVVVIVDTKGLDIAGRVADMLVAVIVVVVVATAAIAERAVLAEPYHNAYKRPHDWQPLHHNADMLSSRKHSSPALQHVQASHS